MKNKKLIAMLTALTLVMSPMAVSAGALTTPGEGSASDIEGDVVYKDTTVYKVTLPTTSALSFTLDPQGLTTLDGDGAPGSSAGTIVGTGDMSAKNESSVAIDLSAKFYVTDSAGKITLIDDSGSVTDENAEIQLQIATKADSGSSASAPTDINDYNDDKVTVTSTSSSAPTTKTFNMAAATYKFTKTGSDPDYTYDYVIDTAKDDASVLFMTITGKVAKNYDWTDYTSDGSNTLKLGAVFGFSDPAATPPAPAEQAPTISTTSYTFTKGTDLEIPVDLGSGSLAATGVTAIATGQSSSALTGSFTNYTFSDNKIKISGSAWGGASSGSKRYLEVEFADTAKTKVLLEITIQAE